ncbi:MAG: hypothetical protein UHJ41_01560, partial [Bacteroidaceae bacterium]|nr:hypothetical protein [Bacteroidaceae bacterium]
MFSISDKRIRYAAFFFAVLLLLAGVFLSCLLKQSPNPSSDTLYIYIDADDTKDSVSHKLGEPFGWRLLTLNGYRVLTGRYAVAPNEKILPV